VDGVGRRPAVDGVGRSRPAVGGIGRSGVEPGRLRGM
jgi:hypothetical protein